MDYYQEMKNRVLSYFNDKVVDDLFKYKKMSTDICHYVPSLPTLSLDAKQAVELLEQLDTYEEVTGEYIKDRGWYANLKLKAEQTWLNALKGYFNMLAEEINENLSEVQRRPRDKKALRLFLKTYLET